MYASCHQHKRNAAEHLRYKGRGVPSLHATFLSYPASSIRSSKSGCKLLKYLYSTGSTAECLFSTLKGGGGRLAAGVRVSRGLWGYPPQKILKFKCRPPQSPPPPPTHLVPSVEPMIFNMSTQMENDSHLYVIIGREYSL